MIIFFFLFSGRLYPENTECDTGHMLHMRELTVHVVCKAPGHLEAARSWTQVFSCVGGGWSVGPELFRNPLYSAEMSSTRLFLLLSFQSRSSGSIESSRRSFQKGTPALPLPSMHSCSGISFLPPWSLGLDHPAPVLARAFFFPPPGTSLGLCVYALWRRFCSQHAEIFTWKDVWLY